MKKIVMPQSQVFWYLNRQKVHPLRSSLEADIVIVGGGMAGLTAAQACAEKNKKVVLLEAFYCGAGASGKGAGFIAPKSELFLYDFVNRYGYKAGSVIWKSIESGINFIRNNISTYAIDCTYEQQDTLIVASRENDVKKLQAEEKYLSRSNSPAYFVEKQQLKDYIHSTAFFGGLVYENSFGINAYAYCQSMKNILSQKGVTIFEETPVVSIKNHVVETLYGRVQADQIIVCTDRFTRSFGFLENLLYQVQSFVLMSQPLSEHEQKCLFPGRHYMVSDTQMVHNYFRMFDNRLVIGGGSLYHLYDTYEHYNCRRVYHKLHQFIKDTFSLNIQFEQFWPGFIGVSKDMAPLCGFDKKDASIYYVVAAAGLPLCAALGMYAADEIIDRRNDLRDYFSPYRRYVVPSWIHSCVGTRLSFALSHLWSVGGKF